MVERPLLVLILGVHRSGTSLLARSLAAAGASLGDFLDVGDRDNPQGYGEHPVVRRFNDELLAHLGVSWDNWGFRASTVDWDSPTLTPWQERAVALLQDTFTGGAGPFVLKDPRCATLAPFWERVVPQAGFALRRLLIVRDPVEVAESQIQRLKRRPGSFHSVIDAPEPMAALWAVTMHEVLAALSDDETLVVTHADLLAEPERTFTAALAFVGLDGAEEGITRIARNSVNPSLYRARVSEVPRGPWMDAARRFFADLAPLSGATLPRARAREILAVRGDLTALLPALGAVKATIARLHCMISQAPRSGTKFIESEARVYIAERTETGERPYSEARGAALLYPVDGQRQRWELRLPEDLEPLLRLRLDIASAPVAVNLHALSLVQQDGSPLWHWPGGCEAFRQPLNVVCLPDEGGVWLLCGNKDPQFELDIPAEVLAQVRGGASVRVEMTPHPVLEVLPQLAQRLQATAAQPPAVQSAALPVGFASQMEEFAALLQAYVQRKNAQIASQREEVEALRKRQQQLYEQVVRAEAQLELLKEFALGNRLERL